MKALIVIDAQNEFSAQGKRPVPEQAQVIQVIKNKAEQFRKEGLPIAWIRHFNKPEESPAFVPGTWGSEFVEGIGVKEGSLLEAEFHKDVYGAFTGSQLGKWLQQMGAREVVVMGFYTHGCVATTAREAIMAGLTVYIEPQGTATCAISHGLLGQITAEESRRIALLHLAEMGAVVSHNL